MSRAIDRLRERLLVVVTFAAACSSSSSSGTSATGPQSSAGGNSASVGGGAGSSQSGGSAGDSSAAGTGGSQAGTGGGGTSGTGGTGAGPTSSCHDGAPCIQDEWCGYATGEPQPTPCGGCGVPNDHCQCNGTTFVCGKTPDAQVRLCVPSATACDAMDAGPNIAMELADRFGPGCPSIGMIEPAVEFENEPDGTSVCCFSVPTEPCLGRPLSIHGAPRVAALAKRSDWTS